jgi:hypothetical protein
MFMFTENGRVKFWSEGDREGMILAETPETANQVCDWLRRTTGARATVTEIPFLEMQLEASLKQGANCAFLVRSVDRDGVVCDILEPPEE